MGILKYSVQTQIKYNILTPAPFCCLLSTLNTLKLCPDYLGLWSNLGPKANWNSQQTERYQDYLQIDVKTSELEFFKAHFVPSHVIFILTEFHIQFSRSFPFLRLLFTVPCKFPQCNSIYPVIPYILQRPCCWHSAWYAGSCSGHEKYFRGSWNLGFGELRVIHECMEY